MPDNVVLNEPSILTTVKKLLGLTKEYDAFDVDIVVHINTVFRILNQMGVGPEEGFAINGYDEVWDSFVSIQTPKLLNDVKTYVYQKVRMMFDPPSNGNLMQALNNSIKELEYRLYTAEGGY